ncbi:MAG TPA: polyphenol oxidase family protein [Candidatus Gracilibacteria bacterium]
MNIKTFTPKEKLPQGLIYPRQTHSANIIEIVTGQEDLSHTDGIWTTRKYDFILGVNTADCAPIAFWNDERYGIIHSGWRGLCNGIIEDMLEIFDPNLGTRELKDLRTSSQVPKFSSLSVETPLLKEALVNVWVGPILPSFEIQKDFCYEILEAKFGTAFFETLPPDKGERSPSDQGGFLFHFQKALASLLPKNTQWDGRSTFDTPELGSWRRDKFLENNRNVTAIWP